MRNVIKSVLLAGALLALGCGKSEEKKGGAAGGAGGGATAGKPAAAVDYSAIDKMVDAAKTGDEFTNVVMECGKLEIQAATEGNADLGKTPEHQDHCKARPVLARANMAIAESTPDKMSAHCLAASMGLDEMIKEGIQKDKAAELLPKVNTACGM